MLLSDFGRMGFDPFLEMRRMQQEMNQRLSGLTSEAAQDFPPVNLWMGEDSVAVTAELPLTRSAPGGSGAPGRSTGPNASGREERRGGGDGGGAAVTAGNGRAGASAGMGGGV